MNKGFDCKKAENCFANAKSFIYTLEIPIEEALLEKFKQLGMLTVRSNFRRPFFSMKTAAGIQAKGILNDCILKVGYSEAGWETEKADFEAELGRILKSMEKGEMLGRTKSVCPVCLKKTEARKVRYGDKVYLEKECTDHGEFKTLIWKGAPAYEEWENKKIPSVPVNPARKVKDGCPYDCGLCPDHKQHTCCVLMEVTKRCDLGCPVCFASAGKGKGDPAIAEINVWYDMMMAAGGPFNIQLSGGEPTMREDLDEIIRLGKEKGFTFFQLNTNGIRIGREPEYLKRLVAAGLNCVFLQFDGLTDEVYQKLRGKPLMEVKKQALASCRAAGVGVVLVPTLVPGVNTGQVGDILSFALEGMPGVRGVHFQPVSYFGRCEVEPPQERYTLPELLEDIQIQTEGRMKASDFTPGGAENAYCSFSGNFIQMEDGCLKAWNKQNSCGCGSEKQMPVAAEASKKARKFVARRWAAGAPVVKSMEKKSCCDTSSLDQFLDRVETNSLAVSAMGFMDAWNLDLDRLRECYIHVISQPPAGDNEEKSRLIPFCAYNLTSIDGTALYRGKDKYGH